jgi:hypothetical protein
MLWIGVALEWSKRKALVNAAMNLRVLWCAGNLSSGYTAVASRVALSAQLRERERERVWLNQFFLPSCDGIGQFSLSRQ